MSILILLAAALLPAIFLWLYIWKKDPQPEPTSWLRLNHEVAMEMAGSSHTLSRCLSKPRSSLEAGKKQPIVWLQYVCGVTEMLLYTSFSTPIALPWSSYDDSEIGCNGFEDGSKWYATGNACGMVNKIGFKASGTLLKSRSIYVQTWSKL